MITISKYRADLSNQQDFQLLLKIKNHYFSSQLGIQQSKKLMNQISKEEIISKFMISWITFLKIKEMMNRFKSLTEKHSKRTIFLMSTPSKRMKNQREIFSIYKNTGMTQFTNLILEKQKIYLSLTVMLIFVNSKHIKIKEFG